MYLRPLGDDGDDMGFRLLGLARRPKEKIPQLLGFLAQSRTISIFLNSIFISSHFARMLSLSGKKKVDK
jgi:hypothetical protein